MQPARNPSNDGWRQQVYPHQPALPWTAGSLSCWALTQYAWTLHLAALPSCEAVFRLHSSQLKPSALPSRSRSVNCLHFTGREPRQTWNKARMKEPTDRALDFSRRGATVSWAGEEYRLTHAKPSPCLSPRGRRGGEIWAPESHPCAQQFADPRSYKARLSLIAQISPHVLINIVFYLIYSA